MRNYYWVPAAAMAAILCSSVPALAATPPANPVANSNYCLLVNNAAARGACQNARDLFYKRDFRASLVIMRKALAISPNEGVIHAMLARVIETGLGDLGVAEGELRKGLKTGAPSYTVMPELYRIMVARHEEITLLNEFADPAPGAKGDDVADRLRGRAMALMSLGRLDEAAASMDRSLTLRKDVFGLVDRAEIASRQNNTALAGKMIDAALALDGKNPQALLAKLKLLQKAGDTAKVLALGEKMTAQSPLWLAPRLIRIETYLKLNRDDKAKAEVAAILALAPNSNYGQYYKALLMARSNQKREAWQIMLALPNNFGWQNPTLALPMAQLAIDTGHADFAVSILSGALSAAPDLLDARLRLVELKISLLSWQSAMTLLTPVKDSTDPRVRKLLAQVEAQIAKNRGF